MYTLLFAVLTDLGRAWVITYFWNRLLKLPFPELPDLPFLMAFALLVVLSALRPQVYTDTDTHTATDPSVQKQLNAIASFITVTLAMITLLLIELLLI